MDSLTEARVGEVRAFNRFYTRISGLLQSGLLDSPYSLTEVRVLFEVAAAGELETGELRRLLGLDAGYLSRILTRFETAGLVTKERSAADARKHVLRLTPAGSDYFGELDRRSAQQVAEMLASLPPDGQDRLVEGMAAIRGALEPGGRREPYVIRAPRTGDLGWVVQRHGELYAAEQGWGMAFEKTVAGICAEFDPDEDAGWIAEAGGRRVGCVFCYHRDPDTAQLRMLLVEPSARGLGLGGRLVEECLRHTRERGYRRVMLWTRDCLAGARRIYQAAGFELESQNQGVENGVPVVEQFWSMELKR
ncbi:helix-turn-helix domain-containing GNAT family N-acetyltransferase [Nonomuraea sp. NPDC050310]|uniref:bifunctional helix-turn-helix transcriptional regulator/GNAT family N-acetyltransferase n=1 Tax=unclassified Nonomuraea TaxID=2593643 RepID=UPI0033DE3194